MAVIDHNGLIKAGMSLRQAYPELWEQFVHEMRVYAVHMTNQMLACPIELLPRAQGMAIAANEIAGICKDVPTLAENLRKQDGRRNPDIHPTRPSPNGFA